MRTVTYKEPTDSKPTLRAPAWVKKQVPSNILPHLKLLKVTQSTSHYHGYEFAFFAVRSGVEVEVFKRVYVRSLKLEKTIMLSLQPGTVICINNKVYKQRANKAFVKNMYGVTEANSFHAPSFQYLKGTAVKPNAFEMNPSDECSSGIHFYFSKKQADKHR